MFPALLLQLQQLALGLMDFDHWILLQSWAFPWIAIKARVPAITLVRMGTILAGSDSEALGITSGNAWVFVRVGTTPKT
jgi:hypothetical protein